MAHLIDTTTGTPAIAYVGETPWHGLGQRLTAGASIETWTREAGLAYDVLEAPVEFIHPGLDGLLIPNKFAGRNVLYRSDTLAPLSVVSTKYRPVQPAEVMDFFGELADIGGFTLETAGAIADGKRIFALARVDEGAPVLAGDTVLPYALLATSYDGTLATTAMLTSIRVVCWNTLSAATGYYNGSTYVPGEAGATTVKVPHRAKFDAAKVREKLGIYRDEFEKMLISMRRLAQREISLAKAQALTKSLLGAHTPAGKEVQETAGYQRVIDLFDGEAMGASMAGPTLYGWLQSITEYVDHERGRDSTRLNSALFGAGESLKSKAFAIAQAA